MERVRIIDYRGARIVHVSYSGLKTAAELQRAIEEASRVIRAQPPGSALVLLEMDGVPFTLENVAVSRRALEENREFVRARAVCGLAPIAQLSFNALARLSQRPMEQFRDTASAMDWLVEAAR